MLSAQYQYKLAMVIKFEFKGQYSTILDKITWVYLRFIDYSSHFDNLFESL